VAVACLVDRLGRSLKGLALLFEEPRASGVDLYLYQQAVDTSTPAGKALLQMAAIFGELERAMLVERKVRELRGQGLGMVAIRGRLGIGTGVVPRICKAATPSEAAP